MPVLEKDPHSLYAQMRVIRDARHARPLTGWAVYESEIDDYILSFQDAFSERGLTDFIQGRPSPVVIDMMSSTGALASLFARLPDKSKRGIAVCLEDARDAVQKTRDEGLGIRLVTGDVMCSATWRKIDEVLNGQPADLIIERAEAGLDYLPIHKRFYAMMAQRAWRVLSREEGMLLAQMPPHRSLERYDVPINEWITILHKNSIDAVYQSFTIAGYHTGYVMLIKTPDSPRDLPFLV